jgi:glycolate oxidase
MKGVVGYDLTRLFVGSEGTLGIITKIILRLIPLPEARATMLALFKEVEDAAEVVSAIIAARVVPSTIEFMDKASIRCSEQANPMGLPEGVGGLLLIEVDGEKGSIASQIEKIKGIVYKRNVIQFNVTDDPKEADRLWQARRTLSQVHTYKPCEDRGNVVVPRSKIPTLIRRLEELRGINSVPILSFGHAGDWQLPCKYHDNGLLLKTRRGLRRLYRPIWRRPSCLEILHTLDHPKHPPPQHPHLESVRRGSYSSTPWKGYKKAIPPPNYIKS